MKFTDAQWIWALMVTVLLGVTIYKVVVFEQRPSYSCSHGVAVMTPEGYATSVCVP